MLLFVTLYLQFLYIVEGDVKDVPVHTLVPLFKVSVWIRGIAILNFIPAATVVGTKLTALSVSVDRP